MLGAVLGMGLGWSSPCNQKEEHTGYKNLLESPGSLSQAEIHPRSKEDYGYFFHALSTPLG
jgi:hypothetical protein